MCCASNCLLCALQVVGEFCMDLAISKAKEVGCSWVTAGGVGLLNTSFSISGLLLLSLAGSNHYGIVAHYTLRAVEQGFIVYALKKQYLPSYFVLFVCF